MPWDFRSLEHFALVRLPEQFQASLGRFVGVVDQHHFVAARLAGRKIGLPKMDIDPQRLVRLSHVVGEMRFQHARLHVAEIVARVGARIVQGQISIEQHAGVLAEMRGSARSAPP